MTLKNDMPALWIGRMHESFIMNIKKEEWNLGLMSNQCQGQLNQLIKWRHFIEPISINIVGIDVDLRDLKWNCWGFKNTSWSISFFSPLEHPIEILWHICKVKMELHELCTVFLTAHSLCHWNHRHLPPHLVSPSKKETIRTIRHAILNYREEICRISSSLHPKLKH